MVENLGAFETLQPLDADTPGHKRAHTGRDKNGFGQKHRAACGGQPQAVVGFTLQRHHLFTQVHGHFERRNLLQQGLCQPVPRGGHGAGDVVDGFVAVQLGALAACMGQCVNDVAADFEQAQLEGLKKADRARADDDCVGVDRLGRVRHHHWVQSWAYFSSWASLPALPFQ